MLQNVVLIQARLVTALFVDTSFSSTWVGLKVLKRGDADPPSEISPTRHWMFELSNDLETAFRNLESRCSLQRLKRPQNNGHGVDRRWK